MAIAFDARTVAANYSSTGTQTTSHAGSASARAAIVLIEQNGNANDEVSAVTYGGVDMVEIRTDSEATEAGRVYIWFLDNIATGTQNVAMTTTASTTKTLVVATMTTASGTGAVVYSHNSATSASASNPTVTLSGLVNGVSYLFFGVIHSGLQAMTTTPGAPFNATAMAAVDRGSQGYGMAQGVATASGTTQNCVWTAATADDYVWSAVAVAETTIRGTTATAETVTLSSAGFVEKLAGTTTTAETVTLSSAGFVALTESASATSVTVTLSAAGTVETVSGDFTGGGSLAETVTLSSAGVVGAVTDATALTETVTLTASGLVDVTAAATATSVTVTTAAAGTVGAVTGTTTTAQTVTITASGISDSPDKTGGASTTAVTVTTAASGVAGSVQPDSGGTGGGGQFIPYRQPYQPVTVHRSQGAQARVTVATRAAGLVSAATDSATVLTVKTTASGIVGLSSRAYLTVTATTKLRHDRTFVISESEVRRIRDDGELMLLI